MKGMVLLPLDGSEASLKAFLPAKSLAKMLEMTLCIIHITDQELEKKELLKKLKLESEDLGCFIISQKTGEVEETIIKEAENSSYIVMSTHGETCDETLGMGSTTAIVVESVSRPVLLVKPDSEIHCVAGLWHPKKALIPLNGAPNSAQALTPVIEMLAETTAEINLLHIPPPKAQPVKEEGYLTAPYYEDYPQLEWPSWSHEFLKRFCPRLSNKNNIKMKVSLSRGDPAEEIINFARENNNDFIAIAWHGTLSHLRAQVLKKVLFNACCPIMLIKIQES